MSSIVKVFGNRVNDNDVINTFNMILDEHYKNDSLMDVKSYHHSIEKEKNKKYD
jgi:hypothetical protein